MEERSLGRSFLILSIAGILVKLLSAAYVPFLNAVIGKEGYGIYVASYKAFVFILAVTSMGAQPAVTKVVAELRALGYARDAYTAMKIARNILALIGLLFTLAFIVFGDSIAGALYTERSALSLKFLAPTILLATILSAYRGYMQGVDEMQELAISQVLEQVGNVVISLVFAYLFLDITGKLEWGSAGGTVGTTIGALIAILYIIYIFEKKKYSEEAILKTTQVKRYGNRRILKKLLQYGLPITLVAAIQNSAGIVDVVNVNWRLAAAGFEESQRNILFGTLNYFDTLIYVPLTVVTALCVAIFPKIIEAFTQKNRKEIRNQIAYSYKITYMITVPAAVGLAVLGKEVFYFLYNDTFGYKLLTYGSIVLIFMSITSIQNTILQGVNKLYLVVTTATIGIIVKFIINYFLVADKDINIYGAVIGSIFAFLIPAIINHKNIQKLFKIRISIFKQTITPLFSSLLMAIVVYLCKAPLLRAVNIFEGGRFAIGGVVVILAIIGGITYFIVMIYCRGIRKKDLDLISPRIYTVMPRVLRKIMK